MKAGYLMPVLCCVLLTGWSGCTVEEMDLEELQKAITDAFSPDIYIPYEPSLTRIYEIRPAGQADTEMGTRFTYSVGANIRFVWNPRACSNAFTFLNWSDTFFIKEAFVGMAEDGFNPDRNEDLERFLEESDRWVFSYDASDQLSKVHLASDPGTYQRFVYDAGNVLGFYDSIVTYRQGSRYRTLKYEYAPDQYDLTRILEIGQTGDTLAYYTYEPEGWEYSAYGHNNPFYRSRLVGIPNAPCRYTYLYGPLWIWHFPFPVKKLYRNGELVFEAMYGYDASYFPYHVDYRRRDESGTMLQYAEEIHSEVVMLNLTGAFRRQ